MKLNPEVFRKAAEMILSTIEEYSCFAVEDAADNLGENAVNHLEFYETLFYKDSDGYKVGKCIWWLDDFICGEPEGIEVRVIALLLAAEIVESGVDISEINP